MIEKVFVLVLVAAFAVATIAVLRVAFRKAERESYIRVDYDDVIHDSGNRYVQVMYHTYAVGTRVKTGDDEGNRCMGVVTYEDDDGMVIRLEPEI